MFAIFYKIAKFRDVLSGCPQIKCLLKMGLYCGLAARYGV